jgi:hypothetical protein
VIDWVVAPVDQRLLVLADEVNTVLPPAQKVAVLPLCIVGAAGSGLTVTGTDEDAGDVQPAVVTETE